jgi:hypothetical protein
LPLPQEESGAAFVQHVDQRADEHCQDHDQDICLHGIRRQEHRQLSKRVADEHLNQPLRSSLPFEKRQFPSLVGRLRIGALRILADNLAIPGISFRHVLLSWK